MLFTIGAGTPGASIDGRKSGLWRLWEALAEAICWKIDLIIRKSRAFSQEEFRRRQRVSLHDVPLFVPSAEDVVISKLEWAKLAPSRRPIEDAAAILRVLWDLFDHSDLESGSPS